MKQNQDIRRQKPEEEKEELPKIQLEEDVNGELS